MTDDPVAIYGAVMATAVLVWDVIKWRKEKRLTLAGRVASNMVMASSALTPATAGKTYLSLNVDNRGHLSTQVSQMGIFVYDNWFNAWRGKLHKGAVVIDPMQHSTGCMLPFRLEPGGTYWGLCEQPPELEEWTSTKLVYLGVFHSMSKRPFKVRLPAIVKEVTCPPKNGPV